MLVRYRQPYIAGGVAQDVKGIIIMIGEPLPEITK